MLASGPWEHRFVHAQGLRFHTVCAGFGAESLTPRRVVVLLHTFPQNWVAWRKVLARSAEVPLPLVALDLRGYGASDKPPQGWKIPTLASDVLGVLTGLGVEEAVIAGHGLGGVVARAAAAQAPHIVRQVLAISSPHPARWRFTRRESAATSWLAWAQLPWWPERQLTNGTAVADFITAFSTENSPARQAVAAYAAPLQSPFAAHSAMEQLRWLVRSRRRLEGRRFLAELERAYWTVPVTEIVGREETFWGRSLFEQDTVIVPGRHFLPEECPDAIIEAIAAAAEG